MALTVTPNSSVATTNLIDPTTGGAIWSGPSGEGGSENQAVLEAEAAKKGLDVGSIGWWEMPDGRGAYYLPGQLIQNGNRQALGLATSAQYTSLAPGAKPVAGGNAATGEAVDAGAAQRQYERETAMRSAKATLAAALADIGMEDMAGWAYGMLQADLSPAEIMLELRKTEQYKTRFEGNELRKKNGKNLMSEREIISYETSLRQMFREWGVPAELYDTTTEIAKYIGADLSVPELQRRVERGFRKVEQAPDIRAQFRDWYGPDGDTALAMYFFDTEKALPLLEKQVGTGTLGALGNRYGVTLSKQRAEGLMDAGINIDAAPQAFARLGQLNPLFRETVSETQDYTAQDQGIDFVFGVNGTAEQQIAQRAKQREAAFQGGGGARVGRDASGFASTK